MHRILIIPLLVALLLLQGLHSSGSGCFDQLGQCLDVLDEPVADSSHGCPCDAPDHNEEPSAPPLSPCDDECVTCHIDHSEASLAITSVQLERLVVSTWQERPVARIDVDQIGDTLGFRPIRSVDPPTVEATTQFGNWRL